jgi:hypothetical protein
MRPSRELVGDRELSYERVIEYETGSILLCQLRGGELPRF